MKSAPAQPRPDALRLFRLNDRASGGKTSRLPVSLAARAYAEIRARILTGALPVGAVLSRRQLAQELAISVPPVSEALQNLERDGLVESKPRVGTRVRVPGRADVEDRSLVREALETQSARLFVERATAAEKAELCRLGRQVDHLYAAAEERRGDRDFSYAVNLDHLKFHLHIAECARCPALRDVIEKEQVLVFNWLYETAVDRRTLAADYHTRLSAILATGTSLEADAAMREHIRFGLREVLAKLPEVVTAAERWRRPRS